MEKVANISDEDADKLTVSVEESRKKVNPQVEYAAADDVDRDSYRAVIVYEQCADAAFLVCVRYEFLAEKVARFFVQHLQDEESVTHNPRLTVEAVLVR